MTTHYSAGATMVEPEEPGGGIRWIPTIIHWHYNEVVKTENLPGLWDFAAPAQIRARSEVLRRENVAKMKRERLNNLAPKLLDVLEEAVRRWEVLKTDSPVNGADMVEWYALWRPKAKAVIEKINGQ